MLHNPIFRWGVSATGAITVAAVATLYLEGTVQLAAYAIAAIDFIATPLILKQAANG